MRQNEYLKKCPYCEKEFEATHLSRLYCSEQCKRRMFRTKKQEIRNKKEMEDDQYYKNSAILARLYRPDLIPFEQKDLIKAGFNASYLKDKLRFEDKMLVTYENHYLEYQVDGKIRINKKM